MKTISDIKTAINNNADANHRNDERISDLIERVNDLYSINQYYAKCMNETSERVAVLESTSMPEAWKYGDPIPHTSEDKIKFLRIRGDTYQSKLLDKQKECDNLALRCEDLTKTLAETEQQRADWQRSFDMEQGNADGWYKTAQTNEAERIKWAQKYDTLATDADHWRIDAKDWETKYHEMVKCRDEWRVKWNQADNASKEWEEECGEWEDKYDEMKKQAYEWERRFHALSSDMTGTCSTVDQLRAENERLHKVIDSINSLIQ